MRIIALLILSLTMYAEDVKLPPDVQSAIDKADKNVAVVQAKADVEIGKIRKDLITILLKSQESVTKKGDLNTALAIKAKIDAIIKAMPSMDLMGDGMSLQAIAKTAWKDLPGKTYEVSAKQALVITIERDAVIVPNPESRWGGGGTKNTATCSWAGYDNSGTGWMSLQATINDKPVDIKKPLKGNVKLFCDDSRVEDNIGSVEVKVVFAN